MLSCAAHAGGGGRCAWRRQTAPESQLQVLQSAETAAQSVLPGSKVIVRLRPESVPLPLP